MKVLQPIVHKDAYTRLIETELRAYFWETFYEPLFAILAEARVPNARENATETHRLFPSELRSLGVPRHAMPQVSPPDHDDLSAYLATLGIPSRRGLVPAGSLRPSQATYDPEKVRAFEGSEIAPVLVSVGGFIVDGHHRWFSVYLRDPREQIPIIEFAEDARPLIAHVGTFAGARRENVGASTALEVALRAGRVWWADGAFYGSFSAEVARELRSYGATFDERVRAFRLDSSEVPMAIRGVLLDSVAKSQDVHRNVIDFLAAAEPNVKAAALGIDTEIAMAKIRGDLWKQLERTVTGLEFVEVPAQITEESAAALAADFNRSLELPIRNFLAHEIPEFRAQVEANAYAGYRADRLAEIVRARYGVTKRKAAFLADQETSLFVSKFREQRYLALGSRRYKWSSSHDERVRHDHRLLNGTIQSWDWKPVTNRKTGARNHPGEDFRCRCVAMPIIEELGETATRANATRVFRCAPPRASLIGTPR